MRGRCESIIYTDGKKEVETESSGFKSKSWIRKQFPQAKVIKRILKMRRHVGSRKHEGRSKNVDFTKTTKIKLF